jgi:hypothetical protein
MRDEWPAFCQSPLQPESSVASTRVDDIETVLSHEIAPAIIAPRPTLPTRSHLATTIYELRRSVIVPDRVPNLAQTRHTGPARNRGIASKAAHRRAQESAALPFPGDHTHDKLVNKKPRFGPFSGRGHLRKRGSSADCRRPFGRLRCIRRCAADPASYHSEAGALCGCHPPPQGPHAGTAGVPEYRSQREHYRQRPDAKHACRTRAGKIESRRGCRAGLDRESEPQALFDQKPVRSESITRR